MAHPTAIVPAEPAFTAEGVPRSAAYGDVYHSDQGGLDQARHVFLAGNGLPQRWRGRQRFTVLETGFGLGLNFLATWQAWRQDPQRSAQLHFVSVEKHPFRRDDLARLHAAWPELAELSAQLLQRWPVPTPGAHRLLLERGAVVLTLFLGDARDLLPRLVLRADALYLDGFSPACNPELWQPDLLRVLSRRCLPGTAETPGATLATWTVASAVREALADQGWQLEKRPGFGRKRDMLAGQLVHRGRLRFPPPEPVAERTALVIGAGIAGCAAAERLAARGWRVRVLERNAGPAEEASGNPIGLMHPALARDDNFMARITRAAGGFCLDLLRDLDAEGLPLRWSPCGTLQLARDGEQDAAQKETVETLGFPAEHVRHVDAAEAAALAGAAVAHGGWFYPGAGWLVPPSLCLSLLARWPERVELLPHRAVDRLVREDGNWRALAADGRELGRASQLILANAHDAARLLPELPLTRIRGQVSLAPAGTLPAIATALCGNGYVTPAEGGRHCFGATFDDDDDPLPRIDGHLANLDHLRALLPEADLSALDPAVLAGRVGFRTMAPDRLPLAGPIPDREALARDPRRREAQLAEIPRVPGLHCLVGLGSRGMVWAPLMAELLAARLEGEPLPLERELADALDPARFLARERRKPRSHTEETPSV